MIMRFSQEIKSWRKERALTQVNLARELGITQRAVGYYEQGLSVPKGSIALKIHKLDPARFPLEELLCIPREGREG